MQVACAHTFFQREEEFLIRGCAREGRVVEWKEQCIDVGDPTKARRSDSRTHGDAIGQHGSDAGLVEHPVVVVGAETLADLLACRIEPVHSVRVERRRTVESPQSFPGGGELRIVETPRDQVGLRLHVVDGERIEVAIGFIGWRRQDGVCVVVDYLDGIDEASDLRIDTGVERGRCVLSLHQAENNGARENYAGEKATVPRHSVTVTWDCPAGEQCRGRSRL